ncbi:glycosyltransferase [Paraclostridium bifermentans]|uniref:glycosyltransferase n=1 Tax=Paraclostridium bifermentans TaxID=1490 RepID=UPI00242C10AF|nr:glycosyltransferase [Paraclostridium bifermentans]
MNILYFTRTMGVGGTEKVILQLCESLNGNFKKIIVCSSGGENVEVLKKLGIKHYKINDIENKNPLYILSNLIKLKKIITEENIDIVHTHHRMAAFYTRLLTNFKNFKFVHTAHNTFFNKKRLTNFALRKSEIISVGESVKNNLVNEFKIPKDRIQVIYNSVVTKSGSSVLLEEIQSAKKLGFFTVGNIGRICEQKGMEYFVKAINEVINKNLKMKFFIIGDGEDRDKIEDLIKKFKLEKHVTILGYRKDVLNIMAQLDLIVLSSLWEGLPLTPIEAFSLGKTVIGTNVDGTPEIIENGRNGILVEPKDYITLAKKIIYLEENNEILKQLEIQALKTYNNKFSYKKFEKSYVNYYKKLLEN